MTRPNLAGASKRVRVVDTSDRARETFETFHRRPSRRRMPMNFEWPSSMIEAGAGRAELYRSNKWKSNLSEFEQYKHIVESDRTILVVPGVLRTRDGRKALPLCGDVVCFEEPMPRDFSRLGPLQGVQIQLLSCDRDEPYMSDGTNIYEIDFAHGWLAAAEHPTTKETILFVYTEDDGVRMVLTGSELAVERDGIVG